MRNPVPVHGRLDRLTITNRGLVLVTDTKSRNSHYVTGKDILQVSWGRMLCLYSDDQVFKSGGDLKEPLKFPDRAFIQTIDRTDGSEKWHMVRTLPPSVLIPMFLDYYARSDATANNVAA